MDGWGERRQKKTIWEISEKEKADQSKIVQARLVGRGFEEDEALQVDFPTVSKTSFQLAVSISANEGVQNLLKSRVFFTRLFKGKCV